MFFPKILISHSQSVQTLSSPLNIFWHWVNPFFPTKSNICIAFLEAGSDSVSWLKNIEFFPGLLLLTPWHSLSRAWSQQKDFQNSTPLSTCIKVEGWWGKIEPEGSSKMGVHLTISYIPKIIGNLSYQHVFLGKGRKTSAKLWTSPSHFHSRSSSRYSYLANLNYWKSKRKRAKHKFLTPCWPCIYDGWGFNSPHLTSLCSSVQIGSSFWVINEHFRAKAYIF